MSLMRFSLKHERTLDEARQLLQSTVADATGKVGFLIDKTEWNSDKSRVSIDAKGATVTAWVDAAEVHLTCDIPFVSKLLGAPVVEKLKGLVENRFQKKLTREPTP